MRGGGDARLPKKRLSKDGYHLTSQHTLFAVYGEMLAQCAVDYAGLPDPRTLTMSEIRWFYEWRRKSLQKESKKK